MQGHGDYPSNTPQPEMDGTANAPEVPMEANFEGDLKPAALPATPEKASASDLELDLDLSPPDSARKIIVETEAMREQGRKQMEEALGVLPEAEKASYQKALETAPHLVRTESDPLQFLRNKSFDPWRAAKKLALYWKVREEMFGERAFLPLDLTGQGALTSEAISFVKTGAIVVLPNDSHGRPVVSYDSSRRLDHDAVTRFRQGMYMATRIGENEVSATEGVIFLVIQSKPQLDGHTITGLRRLFRVMPMRCHTLHIIDCTPKTEKGVFSATLLPAILKLAGEYLKRLRTFVHVNKSKDEIANELETHGLTRSGLPYVLGGTWSYENFVRWREDQLTTAMERKQPARSVASLKDDTQQSSPQTSFNLVEDCKEVLYKAMESIPEHEKREYLQAKLNAPTLFDTESAPIRFLRLEEYHPKTAALRCIEYWRLRCELFQNKAFSPVDQTGEGALERREITVLGTCFLGVLPNDNHGQSVVVIDPSRLKKGALDTARDRCIFYGLTVAAENEVSQKQGIVLLYMLDAAAEKKVDDEMIARILSLAPVKVRRVHFLWHGPNAMPKPPDLSVECETLSHHGRTKDELASMLEAYGIQRSGLPKKAGGSWGYEKFVQWQELRTRLEWNIPVGLSGREMGDAFQFPTLVPLSELSEADRAERKRRMNVVHSRRKRDRERIEMEVLEEHCAELRDDQEWHKREHNRLRELMQTANSLISNLPPSAPANDTSSNYTAPPQPQPQLPGVPSQQAIAEALRQHDASLVAALGQSWSDQRTASVEEILQRHLLSEQLDQDGARLAIRQELLRRNQLWQAQTLNVQNMYSLLGSMQGGLQGGIGPLPPAAMNMYAGQQFTAQPSDAWTQAAIARIAAASSQSQQQQQPSQQQQQPSQQQQPQQQRQSPSEEAKNGQAGPASATREWWHQYGQR